MIHFSHIHLVIASHDFAKENGGTGETGGPCNGKGLMSYGKKPDKWSDCSNSNFKDWFTGTGISKNPYGGAGHTCLKSTVIGKVFLIYMYFTIRHANG